MSSNLYIESLISSAKRLRITPQRLPPQRALHQRSIQQHDASALASASASASAPASQSSNKLAVAPVGQQTRSATHVAPSNRRSKEEDDLRSVRLPKAVQAVFLAPLKRAPTHGIPVCDLQIRSYSVRNLEAFTDFCLRAAYYLNLPAKGPVPLPRITERWTVPRSNFVHKKSQENFERITVRRLIQIQDGHSDTVAMWLSYIQAHRYYGVGLKANVFEHGKLDVVDDIEQEGQRLEEVLGKEWRGFSLDERQRMSEETYTSKLLDDPFKAQWGAYGGMGGITKQATGRVRFNRRPLLGTQSKSQPKSLPEEVAGKAVRISK